jgi:hypothetical protein
MQNNMKQIISASVLGIWLLFEIKDFVINGGFSNTLAFNLLRIVILIVLLAILVMTNLILSVLPTIFKNIVKIEKSDIDQRIFDLNLRLQEVSIPRLNNNFTPTSTDTPPRRSITPIKKIDLGSARNSFKKNRKTL